MATSWTIGTAGGDVVADVLQAPLPTVRIGQALDPQPTFVFGDPAAWGDIEDYVAVASDTTVRTGRNHNGVPYYIEDLSNFASVSSLLVSLEAPNSLPDSQSIWGVIVGGSDASNSVRNRLRWTLDVFVLADFEAYATRQDVVDAFSKEVF